MSLTTNRLTVVAFILFGLFAIASCGDNVELVIPLEASVPEPTADASTPDLDEADTGPDDPSLGDE